MNGLHVMIQKNTPNCVEIADFPVKYNHSESKKRKQLPSLSVCNSGVGARESAIVKSLSQRESERLSEINFVWIE